MSRDIAGWQRRFYAQPKIYEVLVRDESTGNFYTSEEGAEIEAAWRRARKERARVVYHNLHSDELSRERWLEPSDPEPTP